MSTGWEGSAPGMAFLPPEDKEPFAEEFRKDLQFLELLILMISKSTVTGSLDITWVDGNDPEGLRHVLGTTQAARTRCSGYVHWDRPDPSQHFCNVINDYGRRAADSCAICDRAADRRVGISQQSEIYRCHAGLTGIAVPVVSGGQHIATLFSGAVLPKPQSPDGFIQIREYTRRLTHVDVEELERAYYEVPVVAREDLDNTARVLEVFADFLARTWKRLGDTVQAERRRFRQSQLAAAEFAYMVLQSNIQESTQATRLLQVLGVTQYPNRVLVVSLKRPEESVGTHPSFDLALNIALHAIGEVADRAQNTVVAYLRQEGICVFLREPEDGPAAGLRARTFAERALYAIASRSDLQARVGIGEVKTDWRELADSYHQARCALTTTEESIAVYRDPLSDGTDLSAQTEMACQSLAEQRCQDALAAVRALPTLVMRRFGGSAADQRSSFLGVFESLCLAALKAGSDRDTIAQIRADTHASLTKATNSVRIQALFLEAAESIAGDVSCLMKTKQEKLIERIRQLIDQRIGRARKGGTLSLTEVAQAVGKSTGHVSRMFHEATGLTFSEYLQSCRVEAAKRMLLDPLANISEISAWCGFTSPAYFARVFRKKVGCSPREYAQNPRKRQLRDQGDVCSRV